MQNIIFKATYSSESVVDIFRDVSECFDPAFNYSIKDTEINEDSSFRVTFNFKNDNQETPILKKVYSQESIIDLEEDISYSLQNLKVEQDEYGFFDGDLILTVTLMD